MDDQPLTDSQLAWADEEQYMLYLNMEKHLFIWALGYEGQLVEAECCALGDEKYAYRPVTDLTRGETFTDDSWHHAMIQLYGGQYWQEHPEVMTAPQAYHDEMHRYLGLTG